MLLLLQGATKAAELLASEATASAARVVDDAPALIVARVERACFSSALDGGPLLAEERRNGIPMLRFCAVLPPVELAKVTSGAFYIYTETDKQTPYRRQQLPKTTRRFGSRLLTVRRGFAQQSGSLANAFPTPKKRELFKCIYPFSSDIKPGKSFFLPPFRPRF